MYITDIQNKGMNITTTVSSLVLVNKSKALDRCYRMKQKFDNLFENLFHNENITL